MSELPDSSLPQGDLVLYEAPSRGGAPVLFRYVATFGSIFVGLLTTFVAVVPHPQPREVLLLPALGAVAFVAMGVWSWFTFGRLIRRLPVRVEPSTTGLEATLRDGQTVMKRWSDPQLALQVARYQPSSAGSATFYLNFSDRSAPDLLPVSSDAVETLRTEALAHKCRVEDWSTPPVKGRSVLVIHGSGPA
jgi:hypothetical protein